VDCYPAPIESATLVVPLNRLPRVDDWLGDDLSFDDLPADIPLSLVVYDPMGGAVKTLARDAVGPGRAAMLKRAANIELNAPHDYRGLVYTTTMIERLGMHLEREGLAGQQRAVL